MFDDVAALLAPLPSDDPLAAGREQAFADVEDAFVDVRDAHRGERPLVDCAVQLRDGPVADLLDAGLSRAMFDRQADLLG